MGHKGEAGYLKRGTWMTLGLLKRHRDEVMTPRGGGGTSSAVEEGDGPVTVASRWEHQDGGLLVSEKEAVRPQTGGVEVRWAVVGAGGLKRSGVLDLGTRAGHGTPGGQLLTRQMFLEPHYVPKLCVLSPWVYSREPKTPKNKFLPPREPPFCMAGTRVSADARSAFAVRCQDGRKSTHTAHACGNPGALRPQ